LLTKHLEMSLVLVLMICFTRCSSHEPDLKDIDGPPTMSSWVEKAPEVSWCDLIRTPAHYNKVIVRTRALLHVDHENQFLYDLECETSDATPVWAEFDPSYVYTDEKLKLRLTELIRPRPSKAAGTALVTVVGRFDGPGGGPYGHLDGYRSRFSIMRLEQAAEAETITSRPK
jgi:hypothetical protein